MSNNLIKFLKTILLVTLLNIIIFAVFCVDRSLPFYYHPYFWVRQIGFLFFISLYYFGPCVIKTTLTEFLEERKLIEAVVQKKDKIFFWEPLVYSLSFVGMYIILDKATNPDWELVCTLVMYIWFLSFYLACYRIYIVYSDPEI